MQSPCVICQLGYEIDFMVGQPKMIKNILLDRVNNADFRNDLHFFVTSSRPIKAEPKGLKSATFGMQNLPEGGEIENNVMKYVTPIFHS